MKASVWTIIEPLKHTHGRCSRKKKYADIYQDGSISHGHSDKNTTQTRNTHKYISLHSELVTDPLAEGLGGHPQPRNIRIGLLTIVLTRLHVSRQAKVAKHDAFLIVDEHVAWRH